MMKQYGNDETVNCGFLFLSKTQLIICSYHSKMKIIEKQFKQIDLKTYYVWVLIVDKFASYLPFYNNLILEIERLAILNSLYTTILKYFMSKIQNS